MTNTAETEYEKMATILDEWDSADEMNIDLIMSPVEYGYTKIADGIRSLLAEKARLKEALKPFAEAESDQDDQPHDLTDLASEGGAACMITYGELRRARAALHGDPQ